MAEAGRPVSGHLAAWHCSGPGESHGQCCSAATLLPPATLRISSVWGVAAGPVMGVATAVTTTDSYIWGHEKVTGDQWRLCVEL